MLKLETKITLDAGAMMAPNLTDRLSERDLTALGEHASDGYTRDKASRYKWEVRNGAAMDLAMQVAQDKTYPWAGCANVVFPLITIAALQFSARAYPNLIQGNNVVRYRVIGRDAGPVKERADRIGRHMSWQVTEQDVAWEEQHDRMLINLAIVGCNFIKSWYNPTLGYPVDELVMAKDLVVNYWAKSVDTAPRKTQILMMSRNDIWERCARDTYRDITKESWFEQPPVLTEMEQEDYRRRGLFQPMADDTTPFEIHEQHCLLDLDQDGYAEPYILTYDFQNKEVLRIVSRIDNESAVRRSHSGKILNIIPSEYYTKYSFIPAPDGGMYDLGFGVFLGPLNEAVDTGINQLLDTGTMQNSMGGFLGRGAKFRGGNIQMAPWGWVRVDSTGDDLRKNLIQFPERQPSTVTLSLVELMIDYANRIAGTTDPMVGVNPGQNTPASTFQGMTEQGMQTFGMIFKRVWRSMQQEFKKRYLLNRTFLTSKEDFGQGDDFIRREDYTGNPDQVAPVANPKITSSQMRMQQVMAVRQASMTTNGYSLPEVEKDFLEALEVEAIDRIYPGPGKVPPLPNPKVMLEQAKQQGKAQTEAVRIKAETQHWANELIEERRVNDAKIEQLRADAFNKVKTAAQGDAANQLKMFEISMDALKAHGEMINKRIELLTQQGEGDEQTGSSDGGAVPGMAAGSGDGGAPPNASAAPGGA